MTNLEYFQIREIIEKRAFRKNRMPLIILWVMCIGTGYSIGAIYINEIKLGMAVLSIGVVIILIIFTIILFLNNPEKALQKLKEDFRDKKEINPEDYE